MCKSSILEFESGEKSTALTKSHQRFETSMCSNWFKMCTDRQSACICHYPNFLVLSFRATVRKKKKSHNTQNHSGILFLLGTISACNLKATIREFVITDLCELWSREKLNTELKAAIDTMCAAVPSVAALLLSTYFLNDRPAHMLNKHSLQLVHLETSAAPNPICGQTSVLSWWKDIYYVYKTERGGA